MECWDVDVSAGMLMWTAPSHPPEPTPSVSARRRLDTVGGPWILADTPEATISSATLRRAQTIDPSMLLQTSGNAADAGSSAVGSQGYRIRCRRKLSAGYRMAYPTLTLKY